MSSLSENGSPPRRNHCVTGARNPFKCQSQAAWTSEE